MANLSFSVLLIALLSISFSIFAWVMTGASMSELKPLKIFLYLWLSGSLSLLFLIFMFRGKFR